MKQKPICEYRFSFKKKKEKKETLLRCPTFVAIGFCYIVTHASIHRNAVHTDALPIDLHKIVLTIAKKKNMSACLHTKFATRVWYAYIHEMERLQGWERRYTVFLIFTFTNTAAAVKQDCAV